MAEHPSDVPQITSDTQQIAMIDRPCEILTRGDSRVSLDQWISTEPPHAASLNERIESVFFKSLSAHDFEVSTCARDTSPALPLPAQLLVAIELARAAYTEESPQCASATAKALALARQIGDALAEAQCLELTAWLAFDDGRSKDGHDALLDARALFLGLGFIADAARCTRTYGEHLSVLGAEESAQEALRMAEKMYTQCGDMASARGCQADLTATKKWRENTKGDSSKW